YSEKGDRPLFSKQVTVKKDQENDVVIIMPEMVSFTGKVLDSEGKPVLLTWVSLTSQENYQNNYSPRTDGNGNFEIKAVIPGKYNIRTEKEGFAIFAQIVNIGSDSKEPFVITLNKGLDIGGIVLESDGKPAVNVDLTLTSDNDSRMAGGPMSYVNKKLEISADGKFKAKGLNSGKYNISCRDPDLNYEIASVLKIDAGSEDTVITLGKIYPVSVTVEDASGKPISDAEISVNTKSTVRSFSYPGSTRNSGKNKTGTAGELKLNLREGLKYSLRFSCQGYLGKTIDFDPAAGTVSLKVVLGKGSSVNGKVVRLKDGSPVEGVIVRVGSNMDYRLMGQVGKATETKAKTDKEGRFSLETVPAGVVSFSVYVEKQPRPLFSKTLMIKKDNKDEIVLVMPEMVSVIGKILDSEGNPLPSANMSLHSENYETYYNAIADGGGVFQIKDVIPGKYSAYFYPPSSPGAKIEINPPEIIEIASGDAKEIVLRQQGKSGTGEKISGLLKINGKAYNGGKIQFIPMIAGRQPASFEMAMIYSGHGKSEISADGKFVVDKLKPGKYLFLVSGDTVGQLPGPLACSGSVEIKEGTDLIDLDVKAFSISGGVENPDGKPALGASGTVRIKPEIDEVGKAQKEMLALSAKVKDGKYKFDCAPAGKYRLFASDNESGTFIGDVEVKNEDQEINIKLPKGFKLSGKITIQDADEQSLNPLNYTFIFAYSKEQDMISNVVTTEDGAYVMKPPLNQGEYSIFAVKKDYAVEGASMKIEKDTECNISLVPGGDMDLTLKSEKLPVKDRLVILKDENGREVYRLSDGFQPLLGRTSSSFVNTPTNEFGKTSFIGLKPGTYKLSVKDCRISPDTVIVKPLERTTIETVLQ
ncbi:MAG: carboxypeptidase regulatory-like domain-containing protein, partial [Victivallales bacterium]